MENQSLSQQQQPVNHMIQPQRVRLKQTNLNMNQLYDLSEEFRQYLDSHPLKDDSLDTIRMLVMVYGDEQRRLTDQRLITFELPMEACSINEILDEAGVSYKPDMKIDVSECVDRGFHYYIVSVGNPVMHTEEQLPESLNSNILPPSVAKKEPSFKDIEQSFMDIDISQKQDVEKDSVNKITLVCRTIRIGSYRYEPNEPLEETYAGLTLKVPHPKETKNVECTIPRQGIVKVLVNFEKMLPVIFYYIAPSFAAEICEKLDMKEGFEPYFSPLSNKEPYRRITVLPDNFTDDTKHLFEQIYVLPGMMDELSSKEATDILMTSCPMEIKESITTTTTPQQGLEGGNCDRKRGHATKFVTEGEELLIYPPTKSGLPITVRDYLCLSQSRYLNDIIIDFYIKYLVLNLPLETQQKVHAFSTYFYSRLVNRWRHRTVVDPTFTIAQKKHAGVKNWTKHVNLFEKDFVIVPINENAHWFLAIICFPGLKGPTTFDGKPIQILPKQKKSKASPATKPAVAKLKEEKEMEFTLGDGSDKDEAEGDDSDLDLEEEPTEEAVVAPEVEKRPPIKQPCILIFDSLFNTSRWKVGATLRDYLTCEHKVKMGVERIYNKDCIKGHCPEVPQQTNFTDCGLYLLQYVEQFFNVSYVPTDGTDPIKDYHLPIRQLENWFEELTATKKREDISLLIKDLMKQYDKDPSCLPDITLPTLNGKLVPRVADKDDELKNESDDAKNSSLIKGCLSDNENKSQED